MSLTFREMLPSDLPAVSDFSNAILPGSLPLPLLTDLYARTQLNGFVCSHVVLSGDKVLGYRLGLAPGKWDPTVVESVITPEGYRHPWNTYVHGYSIVLDPSVRSAGNYKRMFEMAREVAIKQGANGFVGHVWLNPSGERRNLKAFQALGFTIIAEHAGMWRDWDGCPDCGSGVPCACLAAEVVYEFDIHLRPAKY